MVNSSSSNLGTRVVYPLLTSMWMWMQWMQWVGIPKLVYQISDMYGIKKSLLDGTSVIDSAMRKKLPFPFRLKGGGSWRKEKLENETPFLFSPLKGFQKSFPPLPRPLFLLWVAAFSSPPSSSLYRAFDESHLSCIGWRERGKEGRLQSHHSKKGRGRGRQDGISVSVNCLQTIPLLPFPLLAVPSLGLGFTF